MSHSMDRFHKLLDGVKNQEDKSPKATLQTFVHFLKEMKDIIKHSPKEEREHIFKEFQKHQKEFESAMKGLHVDKSKLDDPKELEKIKSQLESEDFKALVKEMSEQLFEIVKIMYEGKTH
ncbi:MAG: hypothetical protein EBU93_01475 [Chlamydiae bacterium]|jgi:hypothetical protein|nr:hypothetical protein [Chlamydiota bacterium]